MAHGDAGEGNWRGDWRMEWVASTLHTTSEHGVSGINTADAHTASSRLNWRPPPGNLNGLAHFAERWNLVSARVPSHFKRSLRPSSWQITQPRVNFIPYIMESKGSLPCSQKLAMWPCFGAADMRRHLHKLCGVILFPNGSLGQNSVPISRFPLTVLFTAPSY
jgi:hypothetical protein